VHSREFKLEVARQVVTGQKRPVSPNVQVKDISFMEFEQQIQEYRGRED
jgi:hypothetical protein